MATRDSVIILCTGNICRSPMGEALLKHAIAALPESSPLKKLRVCSAGTYGEDGMSATQNAIIALEKVGIDIRAHIAQSITPEMLESCYALIGMTRTHIACIKEEFPKDILPPHICTLLSLNPNAKNKDVIDPYGYGINTYLDVRDEIVEAIPYLVKYLEQGLSK